MANRITYSCNSPDGGSDMDVSDSEEEQTYTQPIQQKTNPHQGMVVSLHNYMKRDSWRENAIGIRAENKLELNKQPYDPASYAAMAHQKDATQSNDQDSDSDSSFHTAPNSPEREVQEIEPGQITEPVSLSQDQLQIECAALEKALQENTEREAALDQEIKRYKDLQETIRIQLLEHKVRNSIARNRKPARAVEGLFSVSSDTPGPVSGTASIEHAVLATELDPTNEKDKLVDGALSDAASVDTEVYSPFLQPVPKSRSKRPKKKATGANAVLQGPSLLSNDPVVPLTPAVKRAADPTEGGNKKKKVRADRDLPVEHGNRLIDAVIDKPFSKRYAQDVKTRPEIVSDGSLKETKRERKAREREEMTSDSSSKETKRERKAREKEEMISEEERKLIEADEPAYPSYCIQGRKELSKNAHRVVLDFLNNTSLSLKEMRLILLNLKEASTEQGGRLTIEQEEFTKALIRKILQKIEAYMTLSDEAYHRSLRKQSTSDVNPTLPDHYYGNIETLDLSRPDLGHHELYKIIRHFDSITNPSAKKKAQQFLLVSGRKAIQKILRTCDPAIRDDADATLSQDETEEARQAKIQKRERVEKNKLLQEKSERKKEKRKVSAEQKRELSEANRKIVDEIDQMAEQIAMEMHINKKAKLGHNATLRADVDLPGSTLWRPKPENNTAHQAVDHAYFQSAEMRTTTVVEPIDVAVTDASTTTVKSGSPAAEVSIKTPASPVIDTSKLVERTSPVNQAPTNAPVVISDHSPTPSPVEKDAAANGATIEATNGATIEAVNGAAIEAANGAAIEAANGAAIEAANGATIEAANSPIIIDDNLTSKPTIINTRRSNEDTNLKSQETPMQFQPYKSALNSLGLAHAAPLPEPRFASLCTAESSGGVCNVRDCNFTHFRDYL